MDDTSLQIARCFSIPMLPKELSSAYRAFCDYYRLGTTRTVVGLWRIYREQNKNMPPVNEQDPDSRLDRPPTTNLATIKKWSTMYRWENRVRLTDAQYYDYENQIWADKKTASRIKDYETGDRLRELAKQILDETPKFIKTRWIKAPDGTRTQIVALDVELAIKALKAASMLQQRATGGGEETVNVNVRHYTVEANPDQWPPAPNIIEGEVIGEEQEEVQEEEEKGDTEWEKE